MAIVWDKITSLFKYLISKKKYVHSEYYHFNEYLPADVQQRRSHLRLELFLPLNFWRLIKKRNNVELSDEAIWRGDFQRIQTEGGMGLNISGSGVLIISHECFEKDDYIEIDDRIFGRHMNIYGQVTRSNITILENKKICEFAVKFIKIKENDYEYLVRSIFDKIQSLKNINKKDYLRF